MVCFNPEFLQIVTLEAYANKHPPTHTHTHNNYCSCHGLEDEMMWDSSASLYTESEWLINSPTEAKQMKCKYMSL